MERRAAHRGGCAVWQQGDEAELVCQATKRHHTGINYSRAFVTPAGGPTVPLTNCGTASRSADLQHRPTTKLPRDRRTHIGGVRSLRGSRAKLLSCSSHVAGEMGNSSRSHHLLKHSLPEVDVLHHFGSTEPKEVSREINKLGQRDLQVRGNWQDSLRSSTSPTPSELC